MFRLIFLLGGFIFLTMLIGGRDMGQLRFGLMPQAEAPVVVKVAAPAEQSSATKTAVIEPRFAPAKPVMAAQPVALVADVGQPVAAEVAVVTTEGSDVAPIDTVAAETPEAGRVLYVSARSVNVRAGPGTEHPVVERLTRDEAVLVVVEGEGPDGWSLIRIEGDGVEGYVAARLLRE